MTWMSSTPNLSDVRDRSPGAAHTRSKCYATMETLEPEIFSFLATEDVIRRDEHYRVEIKWGL